MRCEIIVEVKCPKGHVQKRKCYEKQPLKCKQCDIEEKRATKILERDIELQDKRLKDQVKHDMDVAELDMQIRKIREEVEDKKVAQERAQALEQKKRDLEAAQRLATQTLQQAFQKAAQATTTTPQATMSQAPTSQPTRPPSVTGTSASDSNNGKNARPPGTQGQKTVTTPKSPASKPPAPKKSASEVEWERQKRIEGASNAAIDDLMALTGLEEVKEKFLDIKAKIETVARQGIDMKKERMGMVMLGNPGTGMLYASVCMYRTSLLMTGDRQDNSGAHICTIPRLRGGIAWKGVCGDHRFRAGERGRRRHQEDDRRAGEGRRRRLLHR